MANGVLLFSQPFSGADTVVVTHNANSLAVCVRIFVNDVVVNDLASSIVYDTSNPRNSLTVKLTSAQTGYVQIINPAAAPVPMDSTPVAGGGGSQLVFGADQVSSTTSIRYLYPGYSAAIAQTSPIPQRVSRSGTMKNMYIAQIGDGNGTNLTYTLRINGLVTLLAVTLASTDNTGSNIADEVAIAAGDLIDIEVTKAGGLGSSPDEVTCSIEFA